MADYSDVSRKLNDPPPKQSSEYAHIATEIGATQVKRKNKITRLADIFLADDISTIRGYAFRELIIPAVKNVLSSTVNAALFGQSAGRRNNDGHPRNSYRDYYGRDNDYSYPSYSRRDDLGFDDIIFSTRAEAEEVLYQMECILRESKIVRVSEMYEIARRDDGPYTAVHYGWTNLRDARIRPYKGGYLLEMPRALPIDN